MAGVASSKSKKSRKVMILAECLRGTGELTIARHITKFCLTEGLQVCVVSGNPRHFFNKIEGAVIKHMPSIRYDEASRSYLDEKGDPHSKTNNDARYAAIRTAIDSFRPDSVCTYRAH